MNSEPHRRIVLGLEIESYTIVTPDHRISREMAFPRKGVGEKGERFGRDWSIGTEYNSRPFTTIREGLFLLKAGLRKYSRNLYRSRRSSRSGRRLLLVGGWRDRYAGAHVHVSIDGQKLARDDAKHLAHHLHDHIPLLTAMGANSPVWADELTEVASNRILNASRVYFHPIRRTQLTSRSMDEMLLSRGRKTKPPTLELRVLDSNLPEYVMAAAVVVKAAALAWLGRKKAANLIRHSEYLRAREDAARRGMDAKLCWNGEWIPAARYLDRFLARFREELEEMDLPEDLWDTLRLLRLGVTGSWLIRRSAETARSEHPQTWQRRFAKRYVAAIDDILSGNTLRDFAERLGVELPDVSEAALAHRSVALS